MNAHSHARTHTDSHTNAGARARTHTHTHAHIYTHTQTPVAYQRNETGEKIFFKRKVFKEDLKGLTEVEWRTETGSWLQITGAW